MPQGADTPAAADPESYDFRAFDKKIQEMEGPKRYLHTVGVRYTAAAMAMAFGYDTLRAECAGLLHDCAKKIPDDRKIKMCEQRRLEITDTERRSPFLLHTKLGASLAAEEFGISDPEILDAIRFHTTGRPGMTDLEKIIFIADYIEPGRDRAPHLKELRELAFHDLDECTYRILADTLEYLRSQDGEIDSATEKSYSFYRRLHQERTKS